MDTSRQVAAVIADKSESLGAAPRQRRSIAEKRRIVEETLVEGASVARVARAHGINANQVFGWRRLYLAGRLGEGKPAMKLLPVRVSESLPAPLPVHGSADLPKPQPGTIHIELRQAQVRIEGSADPALVRVLLECLRAMIGLPSEHAGLDCSGRDRLAARVHRAERAGGEQAGAEAVLGARVCVSRAARRSDQGSVVRRRRVVFVREATGARTLRVAASHERHGFADASAVIDAAGRHRLAAAGADVGAAVVGVTSEILCTTFFASTGMRTREFMRYSAHVSGGAPRSERSSCRCAASADPGATRATALAGARDRASASCCWPSCIACSLGGSRRS